MLAKPLSAAVVLFALAGVAGYWAVSDPLEPPGFRAELAVLDCGIRSPGEMVRDRVRFRNTHPTPVRVLELSQSCSCTSSRVTQVEVPPGGETDLLFEWRIGDRRGPARETVQVVYAGPNGAAVAQAQLVAEVQPDIVSDPDRLEFRAGEPAVVVVRFQPGRRPTFRLHGASVNHPALTAELDAERNTVTVRYDPAVPGADEPGKRLSVDTDGPPASRMELPIVVTGGSMVGPPRQMPVDPSKPQ